VSAGCPARRSGEGEERREEGPRAREHVAGTLRRRCGGMQKGRAARAGPARFTNYSISPRELRYAYSSPSLIRARARARVSCEIYTRAHTWRSTRRAPPRTTAGRATPSQRINNRDLAYPRVRRSNELAAASEMHPFCRRCAAAREEGGGRTARPPRDAVARTRRRTRFRFFRAGMFAEELGRGKGLRGEDLYGVRLPLAVGFLFSSGSAAPRAFARSERTVVVAEAAAWTRSISLISEELIGCWRWCFWKKRTVLRVKPARIFL